MPLDTASSHNSDISIALSPKETFTRCVWLSSEPQSTKLVLLCIARWFNRDARGSSMSYQQLARDCGLHERTTKRIVKDVDGRWLQIEVGKGYSTRKGPQNLYHGIVPGELIDELRANMSGWQKVTPNSHSGCPDATPLEGWGGPGCTKGWRENTRTGDDSDQEERSSADHEYDGLGNTETLQAFLVTADQRDRFYAVARTWGEKPGAPLLRASFDRGVVDSNLIGHVKRHACHDRQILQCAIDIALTNMEALKADGKDQRPGLTACGNCFDRILTSAIARLLIDDAKLEAEARTEKAVCQNRLKNRLNAVNKGSARQHRQHSSWSDLATEFTSNGQGA